jgi:hypothetical protein
MLLNIPVLCNPQREAKSDKVKVAYGSLRHPYGSLPGCRGTRSFIRSGSPCHHFPLSKPLGRNRHPEPTQRRHDQRRQGNGWQ